MTEENFVRKTIDSLTNQFPGQPLILIVGPTIYHNMDDNDRDDLLLQFVSDPSESNDFYQAEEDYDWDLLSENKALKGAMQWFVDRCERGEVRSKRTYARFKELLSLYDN